MQMYATHSWAFTPTLNTEKGGKFNLYNKKNWASKKVWFGLGNKNKWKHRIL